MHCKNRIPIKGHLHKAGIFSSAAGNLQYSQLKHGHPLIFLRSGKTLIMVEQSGTKGIPAASAKRTWHEKK